jgi:hypothetical protein
MHILGPVPVTVLSVLSLRTKTNSGEQATSPLASCIEIFKKLPLVSHCFSSLPPEYFFSLSEMQQTY